MGGSDGGRGPKEQEELWPEGRRGVNYCCCSGDKDAGYDRDRLGGTVLYAT